MNKYQDPNKFPVIDLRKLEDIPNFKSVRIDRKLVPLKNGYKTQRIINYVWTSESGFYYYVTNAIPKEIKYKLDTHKSLFFYINVIINNNKNDYQKLKQICNALNNM